MHDTHQAAVMTAASSVKDEHRRVDAAQRTLRHAISCVGVGRHSGVRVGLTLQPAGPDTGVRFRRSDRPGAASIEARPEHLVIA